MPQNPYANPISHAETEDVLDTPKLFAIKIHNDDYTPMDFVVKLLMQVFRKDEGEARTLMLDVHEKGESIVGVYNYDIAATKKMQAERMSNAAGHPLRITMSEMMQ
ncbi:MAG: ATP-dependent Clp protease adaptor ClpS [Defluviitaleaceae bacterium]|nr:ATP-dependent Clp protease adaptor ClpS [Defluviitaleaceae bacterium]